MEDGKKKFIIRLALWAMFACVLPVAFVAWRYDLFTKVGAVQLSGWGVFAIVILVAFAMTLVRYIKAGFVEWSMLKQVINGVIHVIIPLGALLMVCVSIENSIRCFEQALGATLLCEAVAIPLNPLPKWVWDRTQGRQESYIDYLAESISRGKKEEKR